ncbi:hypothetical protein [Sandaracinus amylolyticus]|uniref:hypothetical protein n=1 Tax=Sandaracinus amylolyticus TaxID=927083 RepID=UPI001F35636F|nr:hypothetical protein [Sandaracinus amylolyticus]
MIAPNRRTCSIAAWLAPPRRGTPMSEPEPRPADHEATREERRREAARIAPAPLRRTARGRAATRRALSRA